MCPSNDELGTTGKIHGSLAQFEPDISGFDYKASAKPATIRAVDFKRDLGVIVNRVDDYKHRFSRYTEAGQVKNGQPYRTGEGWMVTTPTPKVPYYRPRQKRQAEQLIEKALKEG